MNPVKKGVFRILCAAWKYVHGMDAVPFPDTQNNIPVTESAMNNKQLGMTMVELMVTLAVVAILASVAAPSISDMIANNRLLTLNNQLVSAINYTRSEAVKRRYDVVMCVRNTAGNNCDTGGSFDQGWIIFVDCNANNTLDGTNVCDTNGDGIADGPEQILQDTNKVINTTSGGISISNNILTKPWLIDYSPTGAVANNATLTVQTVSSGGLVPRYQVSMAARTGRVSSCKVPDGETDC